jgi:hypothetical protein
MNPEPQVRTQAVTISLPDIYTDGGTIEVSPVTVSLGLAAGRRPVGVLRMSPTYAKILTLMLKKYIKQAEEKWGEPIVIPDAVLKDRDISLDDW